MLIEQLPFSVTANGCKGIRKRDKKMMDGYGIGIGWIWMILVVVLVVLAIAISVSNKRAFTSRCGQKPHSILGE